MNCPKCGKKLKKTHVNHFIFQWECPKGCFVSILESDKGGKDVGKSGTNEKSEEVNSNESKRT